MSPISTLIAIFAIIVGTFFSIMGVIGFYRLPDVYTRLHATGKVGVLGIVMLLTAAALATPLAWGKALILILFTLMIGPVTAHTLASAAYHLGIEMKNVQRHDLLLEMRKK